MNTLAPHTRNQSIQQTGWTSSILIRSLVPLAILFWLVGCGDDFSPLAPELQLSQAQSTSQSELTGSSDTEAASNPAASRGAPTKPSDGTATGISSSEMLITWIDNSTNETGFTIERRDRNSWNTVGTTGPNVESFTDSGLSADTEYQYRVRACNGNPCGNSEAFSGTTQAEAPAAPTVPGSPTDASAVGISASEMLITWTDNSDNENGFVIQRLDGTSWTVAGTTGPNVESFTDTGLSAETEYEYRVRACHATACGDSENFFGTTAAIAPKAPSEVSATALSTSEIQVAWTDNSDNETGFSVQRMNDGAWIVVGTTDADVTSFTDTGLSASTQYEYRVEAFRGDVHAASESTFGTTEDEAPAAPEVPGAPSNATAVGLSTSEMLITWTDNSTNENGFVVQRRNGTSWNTAGTTGPDVESFTDTGLSAETEYQYRVRACHATACGNSEDFFGTTEAIAPNAPSEVSAIAISTSEIQIAWTDNSTNETSFVIQRRSDSAWIVVGTTEPDVEVFTDTGLSASTQYEYKVEAHRGDVYAASESAFASTKDEASGTPGAPTNATAVGVSSSEMLITWTDNSTNENGFVVQRRNGTSWNTAGTTGPNVESFTDTGLSASTEYQYRVRACHATACGNSQNFFGTTKEVTAASVTLTPSSVSLTVGDSLNLTADVKAADGQTIDGATVAWSSSDANVAWVSDAGIVHAVADGSVTITASSDDASVATGVTVMPKADEPPPSSSEPSPPPPTAGGLIPAFPGAEGWGAVALNESRKLPLVVHQVTNTNDTGPGTLHEAIQNTRSDRYDVIIFRTGGVIRRTGDGFYLNSSHVYIAGQTAPGDGIAINGRGGVTMWVRGTGANISDLAIRHLRIRNASTSLNISKGDRIILDHLSLSWASRYVLAIQRYAWGWSQPISNVSVQNTIISEVLGNHPTAFVLNSGSDLKEDGDLGMGNISIHRNLMASNSHRNPMTAADNAVIANNVIYNWRNAAGMMNRRGTADWTNNLGKAGPMTRSDAPFLVNPYCNELGGEFSIYAAGNIGPASSNANANNWTDPTRQVACMRNSGDYPGQPVPTKWQRNTPQAWTSTAFPLTLRSAQNAYNTVVNNVGANARITCDGSWVSAIDPVDARVINETKNGSGINSPLESTPAWPTYNPGTPCADTDGDGLPDAWEERYFGSKTGARPDAIGRNGYLLIEHYVNGTNPL